MKCLDFFKLSPFSYQNKSDASFLQFAMVRYFNSQLQRLIVSPKLAARLVQRCNEPEVAIRTNDLGDITCCRVLCTIDDSVKNILGTVFRHGSGYFHTRIFNRGIFLWFRISLQSKAGISFSEKSLVWFLLVLIIILQFIMTLATEDYCCKPSSKWKEGLDKISRERHANLLKFRR